MLHETELLTEAIAEQIYAHICVNYPNLNDQETEDMFSDIMLTTERDFLAKYFKTK